MDALTWFKSVLQREPATPAPLRAGQAPHSWADVPLHLAAARLRPPPAPDGEDWDAVIARAKMQAASPRAPRPAPPPLPSHAPAKAPSPPPPPRRDAWADMPPTPPPLSKVPLVKVSEATHARLDALVGRGHRKPAVASSFGPTKRA